MRSDNEKKTNIDKLMIKDITKEIVEDFLNYLEIKKKKLYSNKKPEISGYTIFLQLFKI